jgi:hypothetical protein
MSDMPALDKLSITELRKAVVDEPRNAQLRHLLGAEMAQQKDYDGAVMEMSAAIALNPLMHVARFQLGLLHLTMARPDHALAVLAPLENLDDESALKSFKRGLEALIVDDFTNCADYLRKGIEQNSEIEPLNRDMQMLLDRVLQTVEAAAPIDIAEQTSTVVSIEAGRPARGADENIVRTDFGLYNKNTH